MDGDPARFPEGFQCHDGREDLHAVIGRAPETAGEFFAVGPEGEDNAVPTRTGITDASTIRVDVDMAKSDVWLVRDVACSGEEMRGEAVKRRDRPPTITVPIRGSRSDGSSPI